MCACACVHVVHASEYTCACVCVHMHILVCMCEHAHVCAHVYRHDDSTRHWMDDIRMLCTSKRV